MLRTLTTEFGLFFIVVTLNLLIFSGLVFICSRSIDDKSERAQLIALTLGVSTLGVCAGFAGGMSREPTVGTIIPAIIGLFGGVALYLFGVDRSRGAVVSLMAACLSMSVFSAYAVSAQLRGYSDELRDLRDHCVGAYTNAAIIGNPQALKVFEANFLPYCTSALDWNLDDVHRKIAHQTPAPK